MVKVFLEYDSAKSNYKIVVFVGSEMLVLDGDDVRVPTKVRVAYSDPVEPLVDDDWFGATLPSGGEIDINLSYGVIPDTITASVYPVEDGHVDISHPILACDKVSFIEKKFFTGWTDRLWLVVKNQPQRDIDGEVYSEGYSLYTKGITTPLKEVATSYTVEDLVTTYIFREV